MKISLTSERCVGCPHQIGFGCNAKLPHVEPPVDCQVDELNTWLLEEEPELELEQKREWLLRWANRRSASVTGKAIESLRHILHLLERPPEECDVDHNSIVGVYLETKLALRRLRADEGI